MTNHLAEVARVGLFAVHECVPGVVVPKFSGGTLVTRRYAIVHVPGWWNVSWADTFSDALVIADDVSRFSAVEPTEAAYKNPAELNRQLGPELNAWCKAMRALPAGQAVVDFRAWRAQQRTKEVA